MWRSKKFILITLTVAAILGASIAGIAVAQTENGNGQECQPGARQGALLDRVCEIYQENTGVAIDQGEMKDAFAQAREEMRTEALQNRLQNLVSEGRITQEEADQYQEWLQSRPDVPVRFGFKGCGRIGGRGLPTLPAE